MIPPVATVLLAAAVAASPAPPGAAAFRDAVGRSVRLEIPPRRIVSLAPNLTEIVFALGLGDRVAGVTIFCDWPPEARDKPRVGGFVNPSLEAIAALEPDLVLATADGNRESDIRRLEQLGLAVYVTDSRSLGQISESVRSVGRLTGREENARLLAGEMENRQRRVAARVHNLPPPGVFVALDTTPLVTAARGTFVDELLTAAGGRNVVVSPGVKYPVYSLEALLSADPDVIVFATGRGAGEVTPWEGSPALGVLRAVREGRVFHVPDGDFFRPGPRIVETLERLAEMFHPEAFR